MSDAGVVRLLIFRVGQLLCATEAERVREILPRLGATRIPGAPSVVAGLVNVRGTLVTVGEGDRKSTRLNSRHDQMSYAAFCLKKKNIPPFGPAVTGSVIV